MKDQPDKVIIVASKDELSNEYYYRRLWIAARAENMSRREWLDAMAAAIYDYKGKIIMSDNDTPVVPDIDEVFLDGDNRWMSLYLESDPSKEAPRRYCLRSIKRLQLIDLLFRIRKPHIARHFKR